MAPHQLERPVRHPQVHLAKAAALRSAVGGMGAAEADQPCRRDNRLLKPQAAYPQRRPALYTRIGTGSRRLLLNPARMLRLMPAGGLAQPASGQRPLTQPSSFENSSLPRGTHRSAGSPGVCRAVKGCRARWEGAQSGADAGRQGHPQVCRPLASDSSLITRPAPDCQHPMLRAPATSVT